MKPFIVTIPHSGERVPAEAPWLLGLPETTLMCDVDRYVDRLYLPTLEELSIATVTTEWHRYAVDLNRLAGDVDANSVIGSTHPPGAFSSGLHWVKTTTGLSLMPQPMAKAQHEVLIQKYFEPFHRRVQEIYTQYRQMGSATVYHLDAHSMPSVGTSAHRDPGQTRAEIVVSDSKGQSCSLWYKDLVMGAYQSAGFQVAYNWPYFGGRVTEQYGQPARGQHAIQVELRRDLYMNETTKKIDAAAASKTAAKIASALRLIYAAIAEVN